MDSQQPLFAKRFTAMTQIPKTMTQNSSNDANFFGLQPHDAKVFAHDASPFRLRHGFGNAERCEARQIDADSTPRDARDGDDANSR
jgi:hypothetical protein